ncbi:MAG: hypothetical protein HOJ15_02130 [Candidatus Jacksonbacteria bacterium]|jgi:hypothetical protein|nr:hypothetical protein [Candidatus Jacksonbacteria bacterium]MBT6034765.1 hypothetical protein [Candidatus Jacksonbacteria bacterium]MBT6301203.1 hypothetical protein [Candidatus Jacksonbacteria bacterium]MBT6757049.1 hypothetical protein [Candidatus Jacksonbacteria bacterium]MBT6954806.1 hypothetical protein [Candidatus Jacksonbacteria bacterium]
MFREDTPKFTAALLAAVALSAAIARQLGLNQLMAIDLEQALLFAATLIALTRLSLRNPLRKR